MTAQTTPINGDGNVEMVLAVEDRKVIIRFARAMSYVVFDPDNARNIANALGRAAYEAHYGKAAPDDMTSTIAQEMRERATEKVRQKMINRVVLITASMRESGRSPIHQASEIVDCMLREIA